MPMPDLASYASPLFCAPLTVTSMKMVSMTGCCSGYFDWNMMPEYVGSTMSTLLIQMPRNSFEAAKIQMATKVWLPQKWPPARTSEMFANRVGVVPNPTNGYPKSSELIVIPEYVSMSAM